MSRTHKTKPFNVKVCQGLVTAYEVHDHSKGPCDLPPLTPQSVDNWYSTRCNWWGKYSEPLAACGCAVCNAHFERKVNTKRNRKAAKNQVRNWARDPEAYDEEVIEQKRNFW